MQKSYLSKCSSFEGYTPLSFLFILSLLSSFCPIASLASSGDSLEPRLISLDNNKVYVVWSDFSYGENEILLSASKDGGITFSAPINLSNTTGSSFNPQIAAVGENVYVVWDDQTYGNDEVLFAVSRDNGTTFKVTNISNSSSENSTDPRIAAAGKYVYIVWTEQNPATGHDNIMLRVSADEGRTFGNTNNLSNNSYGNARNPQIMAIENYFYATWSSEHSSQDSSSEIFLRSSRDNGQSFSDIVNLSQTDGSESVDQRLAVSGNDLFVVWHDYTSTISDVLFKKVRNGGTSFDNTTINLSNDNAENAAGSGSAQIAASGNNVYMIWYELTVSGKNTLFFRASHDVGESFGNKLVIDNATGVAFPQQIAASGMDVYIVWQSNIGDNNNEVFFSESHDSGQNFRSAINLSNSAGESYFPQVAIVNGSEAYVAWIENTAGSRDIVFRKGTSTAGGIQPTMQEQTKQIIITEVELSSANGTQWIEVYNPTDREISLATMYTNSSDGKVLGILGGLDGLTPRHYKLLELQSVDNSTWSDINNTITIYPYDPNVKVEGVQVNPPWDRTPVLTDTFADSRTWQLNGTKWEFVQGTPMRAIPEFPIAQFTIAVSVAGLIAIFSVRKKLFGKTIKNVTV
jgi:hypothetical protein